MAIDLSKRVETFKVSLEKKKVGAVKARVATAFDVSGSMSLLYRSGAMEELTARLVPLALAFDDNGEIDNWAFDTRSYSTGVVTTKNYSNYVEKNLRHLVGGGTAFAPVLRDVVAHYFGETSAPGADTTIQFAAPGVTKRIGSALKSLFGKSKDVGSQESATAGPATVPAPEPPVYLIFQTDGENGDEAETTQMLEAMARYPIYIQFVGVGNERFRYLRRQAEVLPHVGFFQIPGLGLSATELYDSLLNPEFLGFLRTRYPDFIL